MMIRASELAAIKAGTIDLAFRRWARPRVVVGTRLRTSVGLVEVTSVEEVDVATLTGDDAAIRARLDRLDAASPIGPWTRATLDLIDLHPGVRAPELAAQVGRETP